jgi:hypothetical protein
LLPLLRSAAKQDQQFIAMLPEVNPVARTKSILYSDTPNPTDFIAAVWPAAIRSSAMVTFAAV